MNVLDEQIADTVKRYTYTLAERDILRMFVEALETEKPLDLNLEEILDRCLEEALEAIYGVEN